MTDIDGLVRRVAARATSDTDNLPAPAGADQLGQAEARLGFPLHPLLERLYREVADGGFGPEYQLFPLLHPGPDSLVGHYQQEREAAARTGNPKWPAGMVPILTWGCAMYAVVDCFSEDGQVLMFDPNPYSGGTGEECWYFDAPSLAAWLEVWLAGTGWFEEDAEEREDLVDPEPWEDAASRLAAG